MPASYLVRGTQYRSSKLHLPLSNWHLGPGVLLALLILSPVDPPGLSRLGLVSYAAQAPADSQTVLKEARAHQRRFERSRRLSFPWGRSQSGRCDERIGRLCMWHDDFDDDVPVPGEPVDVREARGALITELRQAADILPGSDWLMGQQVRYLVEAERPGEAYATALRCRARGDWWCSALAGYALHAAGAFEAAEAMFDSALAAMPRRERCLWNDLTPFLEGSLKRAYRSLPCEERELLEVEFWWLADPLYLTSGNERRTEHYARAILARMMDHAATPFGIEWGSDLEQIVMRYGWPIRWERTQDRSTLAGAGPSIVAHHHPDGLQFRPLSSFLEDPSSIGPGDWPLEADRPLTEYAPLYASIDSLEHQLGIFMRGDSAVIVVAFQWGERTSGYADVEATLSVATGARTVPAISKAASVGDRNSLSVEILARPSVLSLELLGRMEGKAARARYGISPQATPRIVLAASDILILEPSDSLPNDLDEAIGQARGSLRIKSGEQVGLYWEVYGIDPDGEGLAFSLTLNRTGKGLLRKVAELFGLAREDRPMSLNWEEYAIGVGSVLSRALAVELPELDRGTYELRLEIRAYGREPVETRRRVRVEA